MSYEYDSRMTYKRLANALETEEERLAFSVQSTIASTFLRISQASDPGFRDETSTPPTETLTAQG
jgi:hypothetical protein